MTSNGVGTCGADDNQAQAGHLIAQAVNENQRGEVTLTDNAAALSGGGGKPGQGYACVIAPSVAATLTAGTSNPGVSAPGRRQEDDHNIVAFDWQTDGPRAQGNCSTERTGTLQTTKQDAVYADTIVRRLTELECERLQGYPDQWTEGQSGSARYRQLGNSLAVPVFEWVARRLVEVDSVGGAADA